MIHDVQALLDRLLREPNESQWLEFKLNNEDPEEIGRWISACANAAILSGKDRAYMVFGVDNKSRKLVGTKVRLSQLKKGGENFSNWISRMIEPRPMMEFIDDARDGIAFSIVTIEPTYDRPLRFSGTEYIRIGENVRKLCDFPEHERSIWLATGRRKFENAIALQHQSIENVLEKLSVKTYYKLTKAAQTKDDAEVIRRFVAEGILSDNLDGTYDITNLGAILLANDIKQFPSIAAKSVRVIKYAGKDKTVSEAETEGQRGYAVGFSNLLAFILEKLPRNEIYVRGVRAQESVYSEVAMREVLANALIHQDFTLQGNGPVVEIYSDRVEITNPGNSLLQVDRLLDERRSRNEKLASTMRTFGICEERGGGLDKAVVEIELKGLPAPAFTASDNSMRVVLFGPKSFKQLSKAERRWACFCHCVIRWIRHDFMSNSSLRERFSLPDEEYQAVSSVIADAIENGRIVAADPDQGKRNARYVPYWAG